MSLFSPKTSFSFRGFSRLALATVLLGSSLYGATVSPAMAADPVSTLTPLSIVGARENSEDIANIQKLLTALLKASNSHNLDAVLQSYSPRFVSGDNLTLDEVRSLISETWKTYPEIKYQTKILEIRVNGNWATVESIDTATAPAQVNMAITSGNTPGQLNSQSRGLLFLHRVGKAWEILSDATIYEQAAITYGDAKQMQVNLSAPDQVFAGEIYSAKVETRLPDGLFAIATIARNRLLFPQEKPDDKFRSISPEKNSLERVFDANATNRNEIITATVGLTEVGQDESARPAIALKGVTTLVKRVNVLPKVNPNDEAKLALVKTSANGQINMQGKEDLPDTEDSATTGLEMNGDGNNGGTPPDDGPSEAKPEADPGAQPESKPLAPTNQD